MHLYIVVDCKTANCRTAHLLTYLGEKGKTPVSVQYWMSYPLMIACPTCGKTYDYSDSEDKFRQRELPLGPPSEYLNRLALPEFLNRSRTAAS
jgi:hypothetical protein